MPELKSPLMRSLRKKLEKYLKKESVVDIFIIGSFLKDKLLARDIDVLVLFKEKDYKLIEDVLYDIKKNLKIGNLHIEPLIAENLLKEKIFSSIIHEGFSIRHGKNIGELIGYKPFLLFTFSCKINIL